MSFQSIDSSIIRTSQDISISLARIALFIVYFWFGILKVFDLSPASPLVQQLFEATMPFMPFPTFLVLFGLFECLIAILFLFPRTTRVAAVLLAIHMVTTIMPLFMVPDATWTSMFVPTLEGQYIIKNILIISAAITILANTRPLNKKV
jgi:uncharacterized membrane protein YphA (DoxX/SURF4 family)